MARGEPGAKATESVQRAPAPSLRGLIALYHGYRQEGLPPAVHRGLPRRT